MEVKGRDEGTEKPLLLGIISPDHEFCNREKEIGDLTAMPLTARMW